MTFCFMIVRCNLSYGLSEDNQLTVSQHGVLHLKDHCAVDFCLSEDNVDIRWILHHTYARPSWILGASVEILGLCANFAVSRYRFRLLVKFRSNIPGGLLIIAQRRPYGTKYERFILLD